MAEFMRALRDKSQRASDGLMWFIASTENVARDGLVLKMEDWSLDNFRLNPAFIFQHDYRGEHLPLGRVPKIEFVNRAMRVGVEWDTEDSFAMEVKSKYDKGMMNAVSVGWDKVKKNGRVMNDLLDVSAVVIGSDPQALKERQARALRAVLNEIEQPQFQREYHYDASIPPALVRLHRIIMSVKVG